MSVSTPVGAQAVSGPGRVRQVNGCWRTGRQCGRRGAGGPTRRGGPRVAHRPLVAVLVEQAPACVSCVWGLWFDAGPET